MWSGDKYYDGAIDEFRIYDRAISEDEVTELFEMELAIACNVSETNREYTIEFVRDNADVEKFTAVIAQYNQDGVMTSAKREVIDFTKNEEVSVKAGKTGDKVRVFFLESMESLRPLK